MPSYRGLFVTGTDTGVGKTVVTAALAAALRRRGLDAGVMKPVQTGAEERDGNLYAPDAAFLQAVSGVEDPPEWICPVRLRAPLAPSVAAELEGTEVSLTAIQEAYAQLAARHALILVEGAGGICVPLRNDYLMSDLARDLDLPVLVVARPSLGTINHTVLTVQYARSAGLQVVGVLINNYPAEPGLAERTSPAVIERLAGVPVLGCVPADAGVDESGLSTGTLATQMERSPWLKGIVATLTLHS